jgi:hypothetical protein
VPIKQFSVFLAFKHKIGEFGAFGYVVKLAVFLKILYRKRLPHNIVLKRLLQSGQFGLRILVQNLFKLSFHQVVKLIDIFQANPKTLFRNELRGQHLAALKLVHRHLEPVVLLLGAVHMRC